MALLDQNNVQTWPAKGSRMVTMQVVLLGVGEGTCLCHYIN
jgi:hypothetical protein